MIFSYLNFASIRVIRGRLIFAAYKATQLLVVRPPYLRGFVYSHHPFYPRYPWSKEF